MAAEAPTHYVRIAETGEQYAVKCSPLAFHTGCVSAVCTAWACGFEGLVTGGRDSTLAWWSSPAEPPIATVTIDGTVRVGALCQLPCGLVIAGLGDGRLQAYELVEDRARGSSSSSRGSSSGGAGGSAAASASAAAASADAPTSYRLQLVSSIDAHRDGNDPGVTRDRWMGVRCLAPVEARRVEGTGKPDDGFPDTPGCRVVTGSWDDGIGIAYFTPPGPRREALRGGGGDVWRQVYRDSRCNSFATIHNGALVLPPDIDLTWPGVGPASERSAGLARHHALRLQACMAACEAAPTPAGNSKNDKQQCPTDYTLLLTGDDVHSAPIRASIVPPPGGAASAWDRDLRLRSVASDPTAREARWVRGLLTLPHGAILHGSKACTDTAPGSAIAAPLWQRPSVPPPLVAAGVCGASIVIHRVLPYSEIYRTQQATAFVAHLCGPGAADTERFVMWRGRLVSAGHSGCHVWCWPPRSARTDLLWMHRAAAKGVLSFVGSGSGSGSSSGSSTGGGSSHGGAGGGAGGAGGSGGASAAAAAAAASNLPDGVLATAALLAGVCRLPFDAACVIGEFL